MALFKLSIIKQMKILPVKDQIKITYKEREFIALGVVTDRVYTIRQVSWRNIKENTPEGYSWEDFIREAEKNGIMTADIFIYKDNLVISMEDGMQLQTMFTRSSRSKY